MHFVSLWPQSQFLLSLLCSYNNSNSNRVLALPLMICCKYVCVIGTVTAFASVFIDVSMSKWEVCAQELSQILNRQYWTVNIAQSDTVLLCVLGGAYIFAPLLSKCLLLCLCKTWMKHYEWRSIAAQNCSLLRMILRALSCDFILLFSLFESNTKGHAYILCIAVCLFS